MIQQVGALLSETTADHQDFVGHVGGDDFIVLMQSRDWEARLRRVIEQFDATLPKYVTNAEHLSAGGYYGEDRRGQPIFHALPALSIGCVIVLPGAFANHHDVSAALSEAKKEAKRLPGSVLFIERRQYRGSAGTADAGPGMDAVLPAPTLLAGMPCFAM